ncbi:MAG TPA: hypothetical protein DDW37_01560 [Verrucomicrobiales bacterium]|nr:hypothetical protein [Verrucomicrobiales bacterium]HBF16292.1 hypothetical protein [Verrucomicrobiales bacterium]HBI33258.1 hypothetical protein [Verrucomicrobiales bacterium]
MVETRPYPKPKGADPESHFESLKSDENHGIPAPRLGCPS